MLKTFATIRIIGMLTSSCVSKKASRTEGSHEVEQELIMTIGTYTSGDSKGLHSFRFNEENGIVTALSEAEVENPPCLVSSVDGKFIYTVSEFSNEQAAANTFAFNKEEGTLRLLNAQKTGDEDPYYIIINGSNMVTANYSGRSISVFPIDKDDSLLPALEAVKFKGLGADREHQEKPHLHCARITPDGKYSFADDLGTDRIHKLIVNPNVKTDDEDVFLKEGSSTSYKVEAGSGPRHLTFVSNESHAYLINELPGAAITLEYNDGELREIQAAAADTTGAKGSDDIHTSPDGKFLYASNRLKAGGLAIFSIYPENGMLTKAGYQLTGTHLRNFIITSNGKYLLVACQDSNVIQVYERDMDIGLLTDTHKNIKVDKPVCIKFVP